jgi:hypothetical protein
MKCKACGCTYDEMGGIESDCDQERMIYFAPPWHGWHYLFGECLLCFCYSLFGGLLEPAGGKHSRYEMVYEITGPDRPSPPCESQQWLSWDELGDEIQRRQSDDSDSQSDIPF